MATGNAVNTPSRRLFIDRQRIPTVWLRVLLGVAVLPLIALNLRMLALGAADPSGLLSIGEWLNHSMNLNWVGPADRSVVLYILLLPFAALLIALTRLTLGIRVLGFRAILIAIGFQEIGLLPSLLLILLIATTVVLVRPMMRRSGMPLYARVAVILCIVATTMVLSLLAGSWLNSATLWSMAFFPVVILAMLAESVADTVARENTAMAAWRTATTITLAGVIAGLSQVTVIRELVLACPELLATQTALIVFVSEFLDLRLFESFRPGENKRQDAEAARGHVVLVRNRFGAAPIAQTSSGAPRRYRRAALQPFIDGLRAQGFKVDVVEGDSSLPSKLRNLAGSRSPSSSAPPLVINCAGGMHGAGRLGQVPAICEMLGLPYSGPAPQAPALLDDRSAQLSVLGRAGLSVPKTLSRDEAETLLAREDTRLWVRPRFQGDRSATAVRSQRQLRRALERTEERFGTAMIEAIPRGRGLSAVVLQPQDDARAMVLPLLEKLPSTGRFQQAHGLSAEHGSAIRQQVIACARALGCRDLARIDLICDEQGRITIAQVLAIEPLSKSGPAHRAAALAGLSPADLGEKVLQSVLTRTGTGTDHKYSGPKVSATRNPTQNKRSSSACVTLHSSATA